MFTFFSCPAILMPNHAIRIAIADDNGLFRATVRALLEKQPDFEVVAEAENGMVAVEKVQECKPDVVLMDINMPVLNGIDATRMIMAQFPGVKVIILSVYDRNDGFFQKAQEAGACQYLSKTSKREEILLAIHQAHAL